MSAEATGTGREALADAVLDRLCNVSNLPDWMQVHALGRNMRPLANLAADVILASDWLAAVVAEAKAEAWDEGHRAGRDYQGDGWNCDVHDPAEDNPYRAGGA